VNNLALNQKTTLPSNTGTLRKNSWLEEEIFSNLNIREYCRRQDMLGFFVSGAMHCTYTKQHCGAVYPFIVSLVTVSCGDFEVA
jgi:hypothetical protein